MTLGKVQAAVSIRGEQLVLSSTHLAASDTHLFTQVQCFSVHCLLILLTGQGRDMQMFMLLKRFQPWVICYGYCLLWSLLESPFLGSVSPISARSMKLLKTCFH